MSASGRPPSDAHADAPDATSDRRALIEDLFDEALDVSAEHRAAWLESLPR
jgi:hypothetical protein